MNGKQNLIVFGGVGLILFRFFTSNQKNLVSNGLTGLGSAGGQVAGQNQILGTKPVPANTRVGIGLHTGYIPSGG